MLYIPGQMFIKNNVSRYHVCNNKSSIEVFFLCVAYSGT